MKRIPEPEELMDEADQALDLGCGPADIPIRFARRYPRARIDALDGTQAMLDLAEKAIEADGLAQRICLHCQYLPATRLDKTYDAVLSNSLLHHLNAPQDLWSTILDSAKPGATVLIMDLLRTESPGQVDALVAQYASDAPEVLRRDFEASLYLITHDIQPHIQKLDYNRTYIESVS